MKLFSKKLKPKPIYKIVALGNTGLGTSQTRQVHSKVKFFLGDPKEINLCLIDTQGLFDTSGESTEDAYRRFICQHFRL